MIRLIFIPVFVALTFFSLVAQNSELSQAFAAGKFQDCIDLSENLLTEDPNNAQAHLIKGAALVRLKQFKQAVPSLEKALEHEYPNTVIVHSNLLRAYAGMQETEQVKKELEQLIANGFSAVSVLDSDEFTYLGENKMFQELRKKVDQNANPCHYGEPYKRLDFWIGEWDVFVNDNKIADSKITKSVGACSLHEDYQTNSGFSGMSMSFYDSTDSLYKQTWIDKFNSILHFKETASKPGYLQMQAPSGNGNLARMTYLYDNKTDEVTQTMEGSSDGGNSWSTNFVGVYKRKK